MPNLLYEWQFLCKLGSKHDFFNSALIMISNNFLDQKTILAQILSYMDYKYSIYSTPHFGGFKRNLLNSNQILQIFEIRKCLKNRQKKTDEARIWRNSLSKYLTKVYSFQKSFVFSTQKSLKQVAYAKKCESRV